ncbi:uncharacterized protein UTRI_10611 [Ustilago trichophora]|uniref:SNF7 family protein n=1 Tax=Ustilago trichophora TaxID=86804 RepID=A0A5C3E9Y7_9BASI|nr:uncharacterized protein UTRI_10611 [Ustilago trichophora]
MISSSSSSSASTSSTGLAKHLSTHPSFQNPRSSTSPLPSLYADLSRQRRSNPAGFRASIEWWRDLLLDVTFRGVQFNQDPPPPPSDVESIDLPKAAAHEVDRTVFRLDESTKARWTVAHVGRPLGLGTVIAELEKDHTVTSLQSFLNSKVPLTGPTSGIAGRSGGLRSYVPTVGGVASTLLLTPAKWAASQLISLATGGGDDDDDGIGEYSQDETLFRKQKGDWVWYALVHRLASAFLTRHYDKEANLSPLSCLMTTAEFNEKLSRVCISDFGFVPSQRDVQLVLKHLTRDMDGVAITQSDIIKLSPTFSPHNPCSSLEPITQEDRSILAVKSTLHRLDQQIHSLETQIISRNTQIKTALRNNAKSQATSYLRSRKALEQVLEKRMAVRENMATVMMKIEQAQSDVDVMRAYRASSEVLKSVLGREELRLENVEKTMEGLQEALVGQREVDEVIRGESAVDGVDEEELLQELKALEEEKREEERLKEEKQKTVEKEDEQKESQRREEEDLRARFHLLRLPNPTPSQTKINHEKPQEQSIIPASPTPSKQAIAE